MANHLLEVTDLHTSFNVPSGEVKSVNGISFTLDKNEVLGIVGESGSGKSVTAFSIMQILEKPGRVIGGSVKFNGQELLNIPHKQIQRIRGEKISIIFQDSMTSLNPVWSVGNQLKESIKAHPNTPSYKALKDKVVDLRKKLFSQIENKKEIFSQFLDAYKEYKEYPKKRALEMLELVGINEPMKRMKQYPFQMSGGMLQRVMIAMALICEPELIIADEPTTALDVTIQAQILELLISIQKKIGMGIIIITHDLGVVAQICDKVNVMYAGRIVESGTCDDIFFNPKHEYTKGLINSIPKMKKRTGEKLKPIPGNPVDVFRLPKGCSFVPRCESCMKVCLKKYPNFIEVNEHHKTACFNYLKELVDNGELLEEKFAEFVNSCETGNSSFKTASILDVDKEHSKYLALLEEYKNTDLSKLSKDEIGILRYRTSESKNAWKRAKTDFKLSVKNHFQSRSEKKSIDRNDVHKKFDHYVKEISTISSSLSRAEFDKYISNIVICTSSVNNEITEQFVLDAKSEYKKAKLNYLLHLFTNDIQIKDDYYNSKYKYFQAIDDLQWKKYTDKKKEHCIKRLTNIYRKKGAN